MHKKTPVAIELFIFDLDGTLIDSQEDIVRSVNYMRRELSLAELERTLVVSHIGYGVNELVRRSLGRDNEGLFDKALAVFSEYYARHAADYTRLYPHVAETLEFFKAVPKLIITNKRKGLADASLGAFGIAGYFKEVIGGDDERCRKPSACPILDALKKYKVSADKAMMVGDMHLDVEAGRNAGILTCGVTYGIGRKEDVARARPDYLIDDIAALQRIVRP